MSQASATAEAAAPAAKKKPNIILIAGLAVLLLGGGGGGYWFFVMRPKTAEAKEAKEGKGKKKEEKEAHGEESASEEGGSEEAAAEEDGSAGEKKPASKKGLALELPDDKEVKRIIDLPPFIVNLADKGESYYLRLSVSVGVGESKEEKADPLFTTRVRNAILTVLTTKSSEDVLTQEGKSKLRKELLKAARAASQEPKVEAIYITDLIVQL